MYQTTIKKSVELVGIGLHKGSPVKLILEPLESNSGIVFYRSDVDVFFLYHCNCSNSYFSPIPLYVPFIIAPLVLSSF